MKRQEFEQSLQSNGWIPDRFGHYHRTSEDGTKCRMKMQSKSVRIEKQVKICGKNEWMKLRSAFYSKIELNDDGKYTGFT